MGGIINQEDSELDESLIHSQFFRFVDSTNISTIKESNGDKYIGEIKDKKRHGHGIMQYANNEKFKQYDGFWKENKRNNEGIMYYKDGSIYRGQWKNDMRDGKGEMYYSTGEKFKGKFKEDKREGRGYFYSKNNNSIFIGNYTNDVKNGKVKTYFKKSNKRSKEIWKNGVLISCKVEKHINIK